MVIYGLHSFFNILGTIRLLSQDAHHLDIPTIIKMICVSLFMHIIISVFLCFLVKNYKGLKTFTAGRIVAFLGYSFIFSNVQPLSLKIGLGSCALVVSTSLVCLGIARFIDRKINLTYLILFNLTFIILQFYLILFWDEFVLKAAIQSIFQIVLLNLMIYLLATNPHKGFKESGRFLMVFFSTMQLVLILRIIELLKNPPPNLLVANSPNALALLFVFTHAYLITVGFIIMVCQRLYYDLQLTADTDELTQLLNRRAMMRLLAQALKGYRETRKKFSIVLLDVDYFKKINDNYGHDGGDRVLSHLAQILNTQLEQQHFVSRWGGEEFLILLPKVEIDTASHIAEYLRTYVETHPTRSGIGLTISLGVATIADHGQSIEPLITAADHALYAAKKSGRNQAKIAEL